MALSVPLHIFSPFIFLSNALTGFVYLCWKGVLRSRTHPLLDGKPNFQATGDLHTPVLRRCQLLGCLSFSVFVAFVIFSDDSRSLLDNAVPIMARPIGLLHTFISGLAVMFIFTPNQDSVRPYFPASGKVLWYRKPAMSWSKDYLPIGNGFLAGEQKRVSAILPLLIIVT